MARSISVTCPPEATDAIVRDFLALEGLREVQAMRGVSIDPPGDLVTLTIPNGRLNEAMRALDRHHLGRPGGVSITTSLPDSFIPTHSHEALDRDTGEGTWEEMLLTISEDSNTTDPNTLIIMFLSGGLAALGVSTNALHVVIAGMLIAPGFMPIVRVSLAVVARHRDWRPGLLDFFKGYLFLAAGAAVTAGVLMLCGRAPLGDTSSYYARMQWLYEYWTGFTFPSLLASAFAGVAGAVLVATKRSVFTSGVMIGLALVPTAAISAIALMTGQFALAGEAFLRFLTDVALVLVLSFGLLLWARQRFHRRDARF